MEITRTIEVGKSKAKELQEFLDSKGDGSIGTVETFTANFGNDETGLVEVDIKVCDGNTPFIDAVIFVDGCDCGCLDVEDTLVGEYIFHLNGNMYTVEIVIK